MGIITTMGKFCYVECDEPNCSKKIEKSRSDETMVKELAYLCGWKNKGEQWICPTCSEKEKSKKKVKKAPRSPQKTAIEL